MQLCKIAQQGKIFETSVKLLREYFTLWQNAGEKLFMISVHSPDYDVTWSVFATSFIIITWGKGEGWEIGGSHGLQGERKGD